MFANRFTVLVDACSLVDVLGRNLLLSLAQADFFRVRWSAAIMDETEKALAEIFQSRGYDDPASSAKRARRAMEEAFEDATVSGFERLIPCLSDIPDPGDAHVIAAAIKTRAFVIVTENQKHFPAPFLKPLDLEAKSADAFMQTRSVLIRAELLRQFGECASGSTDRRGLRKFYCSTLRRRTSPRLWTCSESMPNHSEIQRPVSDVHFLIRINRRLAGSPQSAKWLRLRRRSRIHTRCVVQPSSQVARSAELSG